MNHPKGFTLVELMVVLGIISVILVMGIPMGLGWMYDYQFSAATNNFINAAQMARVRSIGGPITMNIANLSGSGQTITVTVADPAKPETALYFTTLYPLSSPSTSDIPLKVNDYVTLVGINNPDFLSGNLFRVTTIPAPATPSLDTTKPKYTYKVASLGFTCESCSESSPGSCLQWPTVMIPPAPSFAAGKVQVAPCVKFTALPDKQVEDPSRKYQSYAVDKYGNSLECIYATELFDLKVWVLKSGPGRDAISGPDSDWQQIAGTGVLAANAHPIVFDSSGATRNHDTYRVQVAKKNKSGTLSAPNTFLVWPSGRVTLDTTRVP